MTLMAYTDGQGASMEAMAGGMDVDLESSHKVINMLVEVLQRSFKADTRYMRPLMPPQVNILFALDREAADAMAFYMSEKLKGLGGFAEGEFRFTHKSGNGEVLQRIRLEFPCGVDAGIIRKMLIAADRLERDFATRHS